MGHSYCSPSSVDERLLAEHGPEARIVAGGTDVLVELRSGVRQTLCVIDVTRIGNLDRVRLDDSRLIHVGPMVTHNQAAHRRFSSSGRESPIPPANRSSPDCTGYYRIVPALEKAVGK
jgi:CO/xanthine dehydrogenase FAD-binding subunit